jgi:hypothetical protein
MKEFTTELTEFTEESILINSVLSVVNKAV